MRSYVMTLAISLAVLIDPLAGASFTVGATLEAGLRTELGLVQATPHFDDHQNNYPCTLTLEGWRS